MLNKKNLLIAALLVALVAVGGYFLMSLSSGYNADDSGYSTNVGY